MSDVLVRLSDVGKRYVKYDDIPTLVTGVRQMFRRGRRGRLWAVRHVDLEINRGEAVGILGRNGSGKSTTLSMMAGVTAPTEGVVQVRGRIAPLLRLGVGFDQELTGRENVFINGMILGMTQREIDQRFDDIVAFAELEEFIDTPVKFYSSGMLVRLGFASAIAAEPDVLIVDEVLAVGDVSFQARSFDRMLEMRENGATLVVVSHNLQAVRRLTDRAVVLHRGESVFGGSTDDAISEYHQRVHEGLERVTPTGETVEASDVVEFVSVELLGSDGRETANVESGETVTFRVRARFRQAVERGSFGMSVATETGQLVYAENMGERNAKSFAPDEVHTFTATFALPLNSGSYFASAGLRWGSVFKHGALAPRKPFYVAGRHLVQGVADLDARFDVTQENDLDDAARPSVDPIEGRLEPGSARVEHRERG